MKLNAKSSPATGEFLFEVDPEPLEECLTALGGVPLLVRAARSLDVPGSVQRHLQVKQRQRGFDEASYVESFLVLNAVGGVSGAAGDRPGALLWRRFGPSRTKLDRVVAR